MIRANQDLLRVVFALPDSHPAIQHFGETTTIVLTSRYTLAKSAEVSLEAAIEQFLVCCDSAIQRYFNYIDDYTVAKAAAMCEALVADALKGNTLIQGPTCPLLPTDL